MLYCSNCGEKQNENARFCHVCGEPLDIVSSQEDRVDQAEVANEASRHALESTDDLYEIEKEIDSQTAQPTLPIMNDTEDDFVLRYVGERKADFYATKWGKGRNTWNWAAFFLSLFWLGYRKMYGTLLVILSIYVVIDLTVVLLEVDSAVIDSSIGLAMSIMLGIHGNQMYRNHAKRQVKKIKAKYGDKAEAMVSLRSGPSWGGFWISVAALIGYGIVVAVIYLIPEIGTVDSVPSNNFVEEVGEEEEASITSEEIENAIIAVINDNINALENRDVEAYMATIFQESLFDEVYWETEATIQDLFAKHELHYEIDEVEFLSIDSEEVVVRVTQTTTLVSGEVFNDNTTVNIHTFRKQDGAWKFYITEVEDVYYLGATEPADGIDLEPAGEYMLIEAPGMFDFSVSDQADLNGDGMLETITLTAGPEYDDPYYNQEVYITVELNGVKTSTNAWAENAPYIYVYDINQDGWAEILYEDGYSYFVTDIYQMSGNGVEYVNTLPGSLIKLGEDQVVTTDGTFTYEYITENTYENWVASIAPNEVYEMNCASCHGADLAGGSGPGLDTIGSAYSVEELEEIIRNGKGQMPPQTNLLEEEIEALVNWLSEYQ